MDPYFDDEEEENQEAYRSLLRNHGKYCRLIRVDYPSYFSYLEKLPPCDSSTLPCSSVLESCVLCSRLEAETILQTAPIVQPGHFIVRPSGHINYPYALSVVYTDKIIYHYQISQKSNRYSLAPIEKIDSVTAKTFSSLSKLLEYYLTNSITYQEDNTTSFINLKLYPCIEVTRL